MKGASQIAPLGVRIPDDLKEKIQERARKNGRSMNSEIIQILQDALSGVQVNTVRIGTGENAYLEINPNNPKSVIEGLIKLMNAIPAQPDQLNNKKPT